MRTMNRHRMLAAAAVCALAGAADFAAAGTIRHDRTVGPHLVLADSYPQVGALAIKVNILDIEIYSITCSGTLIAPNWVLTAGHCVDFFNDPTFEVEALLFSNNADALTDVESGGGIEADYWVAHPDWDQDVSHGNDIGLVRLSQPLTGVTPSTLYGGNDERGRVGTYVGYGLRGNGQTGYTINEDGLRRAGNNMMDIYGPEVPSPQKLPGSVLLGDFDSPDDPTLSKFGSPVPLDMEYNITPGDSGGAAFIDFGNGPVLVGVNSFLGAFDSTEHPTGDGTPDGTYGDFTGVTRVSQHLEWVNSIVFPAEQLHWANAAGAEWRPGAGGFNNAGGSPVVYQDTFRVRFDPGYGNATVNITAAVAPRGVEVEVAGGDTYVMSSSNGQGKITGITGFIKLGNGRLVIGTPNDYTGPTDVVAGELVFAAPQDIGHVTVDNATLTVQAPSRLGKLRTIDGSIVFAPGAGVTVVDELHLEGSFASVDLGDNSLVVNYAGASPHDQLRTWVLEGESAFSGIFTTANGPAGSPPVTVAVVDNQLIRVTEWDGRLISDGADFDQVILAYALVGDVNLDGVVSELDYANLVANMGNAGSWLSGDMDFDGAVTQADFEIVTANMGNSSAGAAHMMVQVPEPTLVGLLIVPTLLGGRRRRRAVAI
jgi:autotransporter-associated beta strand protein